MKKNELTAALAEIHNTIAEVTVSGDNAIRIGNALLSLRALVQTVANEGVVPDESDGGDTM